MPTEHLEYVVADGDAARATDAVLRYQLTRRPFWVSVLAVAVGSAFLINVGLISIAGPLLALMVVLPVVVLMKRRQLRSAMLARGFDPGDQLSTDFDDGGFTVTSGAGSGVHKYADVASVAVVAGMVLLRLQPDRFLVVLPVSLVPDGRLSALRT